MTDSPDDRPPLARALQWASEITTIAAEMVVPIVLGHWLDRWLGTKVLFTALGAIAGLAIGLWSLLRIAQPARREHDGRQGEDRRG